MPRKLALFFDGTWNTPGSETNVCQLYRLTVAHRSYRQKLTAGTNAEEHSEAHTPDEQLKYYHPGVGTSWGSRLLGGLFGLGLARHIRDGLLWLATHYQKGDQIYIFGFSRGAYTARSLVGLIRKCGIPYQDQKRFSLPTLQGLVDTAYRLYRERLLDVDSNPFEAFRTTYSWPETPIHLLGVWDTVGALGLPIHEVFFSADSYRFHDTQLSKIVTNAYHALALDEHRPDFLATMWDISKPAADGQTVEQRWFPGAHADVGGGYKEKALSEIPLKWMQEKAKLCGLAFSRDIKPPANAHLAKMHDSLNEFAFGLYARLPWIYGHYRPRGMGLNETIDDSALKRRAENGRDAQGRPYDPPSLHDM